MAKDFEKAYAFTSPGFRAVVKLEDYRNRFGGAAMWRSAEVVSVDCPTPEKCKAMVRLEVQVPFAKKRDDTFATHREETWLLESNQWVLFENVKN